MIITTGTQDRLVAETTAGAGVTSREGSILSDSVAATLWVGSISSGTLSVSVYTLTDTDREILLFSFPVVSADTANLLFKKSGVSLQRFRVQATYTGICSYEIYVRAVAGAGESSSRILGSDTWRVSQTNATAVAAVLVASSLEDRNGLQIKNWSTSGTVFIAESLVKATTSGYPLAPKDALSLTIAAGAAIYAVTDGGTVDIRIAESGS